MEAVNDNMLEWGYVKGSVAEKYHKDGKKEGIKEGTEKAHKQSVLHMTSLGRHPSKSLFCSIFL